MLDLEARLAAVEKDVQTLKDVRAIELLMGR